MQRNLFCKAATGALMIAAATATPAAAYPGDGARIEFSIGQPYPASDYYQPGYYNPAYYNDARADWIARERWEHRRQWEQRRHWEEERAREHWQHERHEQWQHRGRYHERDDDD